MAWYLMATLKPGPEPFDVRASRLVFKTKREADGYGAFYKKRTFHCTATRAQRTKEPVNATWKGEGGGAPFELIDDKRRW